MSYLLDVFAQPPPTRSLCPSIFDTSDLSPTTSEGTTESVKKNQDAMKSENLKKEKSVNIENVADFSDPLRAASLSPSSLKLENVELQVQRPFDIKFRSNLSSTILSISPFVSFPLPYLETEAGKNCLLRSCFPDELFFSKQWSSKEKCEKIEAALMSPVIDKPDNLRPTPEFLTMKIQAGPDNAELQTAIADYRRSGGLYKKVTTMKKIEKKSEVVRLNSSIETFKDALDIYNHQRLPVLFCSYYYNTRELPTSFCAQPLMLDMHFYGQDDIMLGLFLERYCFKSSYICPSCKLPMMSHVRKYAHSMGVVTVKLAEDPIKNENSNILMTSRCTICNTMVSLN